MTYVYSLVTRMMLVAIVVNLSVSGLQAQAYATGSFMNSGNPGTLNTETDASTTGWTSITTSPQSANVWSAAQTLPFSFSFFGTAVTEFKVSQNMVLTFDVSATTLPGDNTSLPSVSLPDRSIAAMWDDFTATPPTGSGDVVYMKTFGTAPNRQLWIKWFSFEYSTTSFQYTSIVLEEGTNKIYVVDMYGSNSTPETTVGVQKNASEAVQITGSPNINTGGNGTSIADNDYWEFSPQSPCTSPPTAGNTLSSTNTACSGSSFVLSLTGGTSGSGQTYQWQSSPDNSNWTDIPGATAVSYVATQTASTHYRAVVTCGGLTDNSISTLVTTPALVSGNFTIDAGIPTGGTNFQTFAEAINHIKCGINGPVFFNVVFGTYSEQVVIPEIYGASATNTITFKGNLSTLSVNTSNSSARTGILLDGADHVKIDSLVIDVSSGSYGWGVALTNQADSNTIANSVIITSTSSTSTNYIGVVINGSATGTGVSGNNGNGNRIVNNTITGGVYGVYLYGNSSSQAQNNGNIVRGNRIRDFYQYGVYAIYQSGGLIISKNDISRPTRSFSTSTTTYGIMVTTGTSGATIEKNRIHNLYDAMPTTAGTLYGIYVSADANEANTVINNLIYNTGGNPTTYGIANSGGDSLRVYHNTVALDDLSATSGATYGLYQTTAAYGIEFKNNIVYINRTGTGNKRAIWFNNTSSTIESDNNVLVMLSAGGTTNLLGQYGSTTYATLPDWQTANSSAYDQSSLSVDPLFTNPSAGEYVPSEVAISNTGIPGLAAQDILDSTRAALPDPGAYEFTVVGIDASLEWVAPGMPATLGSQSVTVAVTNNSSAGNINSVNISYTDGNTANVTQIFTGLNIAPAATKQLTFTTPYNVTGRVTLLAHINLVNGTNDLSTLNDTARQVLCFPLKGSYTINQTIPSDPTNFMTFGEAIAALTCTGIDSAVVFNVVNGTGPYYEQVVIPSIQGASTSNTVTFNGNGESIWYNTANSSARAAIHLDGADHVIIDSFMIDVTAGSYGWGIALTNQADSNIIRKNTIQNSTTTTSTNFISIALNGSATGTAVSGNNGSANQILNNMVTGGAYGIYLYGNSAALTQNSGNRVEGNIVKDFYTYGIYSAYQSNAIISNNDLSRPVRTYTTSATHYGIFFTTGNNNSIIEKNRIHNMYDAMPATAGSFYGIYVSSDAHNVVSNNLVYNIGGNATVYGIADVGGDSLKVYHNTIALTDQSATSATTYGFYQSTAADGIEFRNNIVYINRSGTGNKRALYFANTSSTIASDNNVLVMLSAGGTSNLTGQYGTTTYATLANWQTANSGVFDQSSVASDPAFVSPGLDYTPTSAAVNNIGSAVGIPDDITGKLRNMSLPDPGAYEFSLLTTGRNLSAEMLVSPVQTTNGCFTAGETVSLRVRNNSTSTIDFSVNPATVSIDVTGAITQALTQQLTTGTLQPDSALVVVITTPLDMTAAGNYTFSGGITVGGDVDPANDTIVPVTVQRSALSTGLVTVTPDQYCAGTDIDPILSVPSATGYGGLQWQQSNTSGTGFSDILGGDTNPFTDTASVTQTRYYRLIATCGSETVTSAEVMLEYGDPMISASTDVTRCGSGTATLVADANVGDVKWYTTASGGTAFHTGDTLITPVLNDTTTYYVAASFGGAPENIGRLAPASPTSLTASPRGLFFDASKPFRLNAVDLYPFTAGSGTVEVQSASGVTLAGPANITWTAGTGAAPQTVALNLDVPAGSGMQLIMTSMTGSITYEFSLSAGDYPYSSADGSVSITAARLSSGSSTSSYYYFYNWSISTGCESPRVAITANVSPAPALTVSPDTTVCNNGIQMLEVISNTADFDTYQWNPHTSLYTDAAATVPYTGGSAMQVYIKSNIPGNHRYTVTATNSSTLCGGVDSVDVLVMPDPVLTSSAPDICNSGSVTLSLDPPTGYGNAGFQWQESSNGTTFTSISGATNAAYTTPVISQTMYYRLLLQDGSGATCSQPQITVTVNQPQVTGTTGASRCGSGTLTLAATGSAGTTLEWYTAATGGSPVHTGSSFTTPTLSNTTNYYVAAVTGGGGSNASAIQVTEIDLGSTDGLEIQNVSPYPVDVTGWRVAISDDYSVITDVNPNIQTLNGVMAPGEIRYWTDGSTNDWGSNMFWNPGSNGWVVILDNNNNLADAVFFDWSSSDIQSATLNIGGTTISPAVKWTGNGISAGTLPTGSTLSRQGNLDNNVASDFTFSTASLGTTNTALSLPFTGFACSSARTVVTATINPASGTAGTAGTTVCDTVSIAANTTAQFSDGCAAIATLYSTGSSPVSGTVAACVMIDATVPVANGQPFVQRHYTIEPASNAASATGFVTLYYLQSEFDAYNAAKGTYPALPSNPTDSTGKANLRISQFHGTVTTPGTGSATLISPHADSIVWNPSLSRWEISFGVNGFSAFFVHTGNFVLPVNLVSFRGEIAGESNRLLWTTASENNNKGFDVERSKDGNDFHSIGWTATKAENNGNSTTQLDYSFDDRNPLQGASYYRLKQTDRDGRTSYSKVIRLERRITDISLSKVYPSPAVNLLNVVFNAPRNERVTLIVTDLSGKTVIRSSVQLPAGTSTSQLHIQKLAAGTYLIKALCNDGCRSAVHRFVKH